VAVHRTDGVVIFGFNMMRIYNKKSVEDKRKILRNNMTEEEVILWSFIKEKKLSDIRFRRQYSVGPYIVDFYSIEYKLAIELDGGQHFEDDNVEYDKQRTKYLESLHIKVIRFTNFEIRKNLNGVLELISHTVQEMKNTTPSLRDTPPKFRRGK
jgi:very-short-patch-repair endonuclease